MANQADPEAEFQNELRVFDNDVDEVVQCLLAAVCSLALEAS
jgi:hypothetical protein